MPLGEARAFLGLADGGDDEDEPAEEGEPDEDAVAEAAAEAELAEAMGADDPSTTAAEDEATADAEAQLDAALAAGADEETAADATALKKKKKPRAISEAKPPPSARKGTVKVGGKNTGEY